MHVAFSAAHAREIYRSLAVTAFEAGRQPDPLADVMMLTLQRDDSVELRDPPVSTYPYLFKATYLGGDDRELELLFFTTLENDRDNFEPYNFGDKIEISRYVRNTAALARLSAMLERALIEGDGKNYSLVCVCLEIPEESFQISGIQFRLVGNSAFRAWPLFLFTQAALA